MTVHEKTLHKSAIFISRYRPCGTNGKVYFIVFPGFLLLRCGYHSRTLLPTLDSRNVRFSYSGTFSNAMSISVRGCTDRLYGEIYDKYMAAVKQLHASFARIYPSLSLFSSSSKSKFCASLPLVTSRIT